MNITTLATIAFVTIFSLPSIAKGEDTTDGNVKSKLNLSGTAVVSTVFRVPHLTKFVWCGEHLLIVDQHTISEFDPTNEKSTVLLENIGPIDSQTLSCSNDAKVIVAYSGNLTHSTLYIFHDGKTTSYDVGINMLRHFGMPLSADGKMLIVDGNLTFKNGSPSDSWLKTVVSDSLPVFWFGEEPIIRRGSSLLSLTTGRMRFKYNLSSDVEKVDICGDVLISQIRHYDDTTDVEVRQLPLEKKLNIKFGTDAEFAKAGQRCVVYNTKLNRGISVVSDIFPFIDGEFVKSNISNLDIEPEIIPFPVGCQLMGSKLDMSHLGKETTDLMLIIQFQHKTASCKN